MQHFRVKFIPSHYNEWFPFSVSNVGEKYKSKCRPHLNQRSSLCHSPFISPRRAEPDYLTGALSQVVPASPVGNTRRAEPGYPVRPRNTRGRHYVRWKTLSSLYRVSQSITLGTPRKWRARECFQVTPSPKRYLETRPAATTTRYTMVILLVFRIII